MRVRVSLFGDVGKYQRARGDGGYHELADGATVGELLAALGIDPSGQPLTIGVNGSLSALDAALRDGDHLLLVTPMEGGCVRRLHMMEDAR